MSADTGSGNDLARLQKSPAAVASLQNAQQYLRNRRYGPALAAFRKLTEQFPGIPHLWGELGMAAAGELEFEEAEVAFKRATALTNADVDLFLTIGMQYYRMRRLEQASECHLRAVALDPSSVNARLTLASWYERIRKLDESWECVETCLAQHPNNPRARYFKAFLLNRKGQNTEAESLLRDLLKSEGVPPEVQANGWHQLGVVLDALGQYPEALPCLGKSKSLRRQFVNAAAMEQTYEMVAQTRRKVLAELTPDMVKKWRDDAAATPTPMPLAFLGGAPRSGTTLIEQILGAHPGILAVDEPQGFAHELLPVLHPTPPAKGLTTKSLNFLTASERGHLIARYFKSALREAPVDNSNQLREGQAPRAPEIPSHKLFIDKNPSVTASLHIWLRLFPLSKIIIALRDPRDVIISCYFQNIKLMWGNVAFLSLDKTAKFYGDCMDVWLRMRELGGFDWLESRYEDVVKDLEAEGRRVTSFLGLTWDPAQATYYENARHKFVHAPTYEEVTKPVYKKAVGRWENYSEALAPFQETLVKYCKTFGYA